MHERDGKIVYSPSDLTKFLESPFASWMDRFALERPAEAPAADAEDAAAALVKKLGTRHEQAFLDALRAEGRDVVEIARGPGSVADTTDALRAGRDVVYQAALAADGFEGFADFLVRVPAPSRLGTFSYEVWDTKLAGTARPKFLLQLCAYAEMLEAVQGVRPREVAVVLGTGARQRFRTDDYLFYGRLLRRAFLEAERAFEPDLARRPLPEDGADHGRWSGLAERILEERDDLGRVAGLTAGQARRLAAAGIDTLRALGETAVAHVPRIDDAVLARLKAQARLQLASSALERPAYELIPADPEDPRRGLALLPPPSPLDVYFDMEGYPFAPHRVEYLFGACVPGGERLEFRDWWALDAAQERRAFEDLVDFAFARWRDDPRMHIYHYASYEVAALRRLSTAHGTREDEVDELLRGGVFVDLYPIVRQALRVGERAYSLKNVERLYRPARGGAVGTAADSVVEYERWLEAPDGADWRSSAILGAIRDYNREDCESTADLARWLRARQAEAGIAWRPPAPGKPREEKPAAAASAAAARLLAAIPPDRSADPGRWAVQELLAHLLDFHRREQKPMWWAMFDRHAMTEQELREDLDCLGGLERTGRAPEPSKRSLLYEYRFDPDQDTKLAAGSKVIFAHDLDRKGLIETFDAERGLLTLRIGPGKPEPPRRLSLIPDEYVGAEAIEESILRTATRFGEGGAMESALRDLLTRAAPRIRGRAPGAPVVPAGVDLLEGAVAAIAGLEGSTLCVQGPPGSGKTFVAARAIVRLIREGRRVAVSSNSHKAILNLLEACQTAARETGGALRALKIGGEEDDRAWLEGRGIAHATSAKEVALDGADAPDLVGGTAWALSAAEAAGRFDHLFVDEAGQVSIANLVGMAPCARSLVLVGDQMQLAQPAQGAHPGESGLSALAYALGDRATIPEHLGIFLGTTRRMHPAVCGFISGGIYEDRLAAHERTARRTLVLPPGGARRVGRPAGIIFVPVEHEGNAQASDEEVAAVREVVEDLLRCAIADPDGGPPRPLALADILFVAPYNMQVRRLRAALGAGARVGSVDRFQGQEAAVVVVSMCASAGEGSSRGIEFLFSPNRLNVAVSRAQTLAVVVGHPRLARTRCTTTEQMKLVNLFCRAVEAGSG